MFGEPTSNYHKLYASDLDGIMRGKIVDRKKFDKSADGIGFCGAIFEWDCQDEIYLEGCESNDIRMVSYPKTTRYSKWEKSIARLCDFPEDPRCPRSLLRRLVDQCEEAKIMVYSGFELEWFMLKSGTMNPITSGKAGYSMLRTSQNADMCQKIINNLNSYGIPVESFHTETGYGMYEAAIAPSNALEAADRAILFKNAIKEMSSEWRITPTFMAKPMQFQPGSAMHIHTSIFDKKTGKNIFSNKNGSETQLFYYAIAGLQNHFSGAMALVAPYVNFYRRPPKNDDAPANLGWGVDNRTVGLRVPVSNPVSRRIENRIPGADSNPYLAIAATLACIWLGLEEEKMPKKPKLKSLEGVATLPRNLDIALDMLEKSDAMHKTLGERFVKLFAEVKRTEAEAFLDVISPWERQYLLLNV